MGSELYGAKAKERRYMERKGKERNLVVVGEVASGVLDLYQA